MQERSGRTAQRVKKLSSEHIDRLAVSLGNRHVGTLSAGARGTIYFEYSPAWLASGFDLAPKGSLQFTPTLQQEADKLFNGLHGVFADSLPDGWGHLLMDKALRLHRGWHPREITPLDRLSYMGSRAMGALTYAPEMDEVTGTISVDLGALAAAAVKVMSGQDDDVLRELMLLGGSPGGARPKVALARKSGTGESISGFSQLPPDYAHWLVKFRAQSDPIDTGRAEYVYARMAMLAGLDMPPTDLIEVSADRQVESFFAVKRFDRVGSRAVHMLSMSGYLNASHRLPSIGYETILSATWRITQSTEEVAKAFRLMVFNVLAHNRDDHAKNFAFLHDGSWRLSPAFDLTMSAGPGGEHSSDVNGSGNPARKDIMAIATMFRIKDAGQIVAEVCEAVSHWPAMAAAYGVSRHQISETAALIDRAVSRIGTASNHKSPRRA